MFGPFKKLKLASAFLGVPEDPAHANSLEIAEIFGRLDFRSLGLDTERLLAQDGVRALYDSRYLPQPEPLDRLLEYGEGTLGHEVARYLQRSGQKRLIGPPAGFDFKEPSAYLALRVRMTHPIIHILTDYDATLFGELAVQSYYVGQLGNLMSGVMISSALLEITRDMPGKLGDALAILAEAYQRGQTAKPFLGIAWEELWSAQVPQLRELADLVPRSTKIAQLTVEEEPPPPPPPARPAATAGSGLFRLTPEAAPAPSSSARAGGGGSGLFRLSPEPSGGGARGGSGVFRLGGEAPASPPPAEDRVEPRPRPVSQSKLLASFMALSEEASRDQAKPATQRSEVETEAEPELLDPSPVRTASRPPPPPPTARIITPQAPRPPSKPHPAAPPEPKATPAPAPAPAPAQPGFSVEEADPKIQPALSPDDPDFF